MSSVIAYSYYAAFKINQIISGTIAETMTTQVDELRVFDRVFNVLIKMV